MNDPQEPTGEQVMAIVRRDDRKLKNAAERLVDATMTARYAELNTPYELALAELYLVEDLISGIVWHENHPDTLFRLDKHTTKLIYRLLIAHRSGALDVIKRGPGAAPTEAELEALRKFRDTVDDFVPPPEEK